MIDTIENAKMFTRRKDENNSLYECYARRNGLQGKSLLILMWLYYNPNGIIQNKICEHTYSTKQVVNATIKSFEKKGYIFFEENIEDRRAKKVKLTQEGRAYAAKILEPLEKVEVKAMSKLTEEQQKQFTELFTIFNSYFKENMEQLMKGND